jgi:hypothetical protein
MRLLDLDRLLNNDRPPLASAGRPAADPIAADLPPEWHLVWDERAAIIEYDGGLCRERAEHLALVEVLAAIRQAEV